MCSWSWNYCVSQHGHVSLLSAAVDPVLAGVSVCVRCISTRVFLCLMCFACPGLLHPEPGVLCGKSLQGAWLRHVGERQQIQQRQHWAAFQVSRRPDNTTRTRATNALSSVPLWACYKVRHYWVFTERSLVLFWAVSMGRVWDQCKLTSK